MRLCKKFRRGDSLKTSNKSEDTQQQSTEAIIKQIGKAYETILSKFDFVDDESLEKLKLMSGKHLDRELSYDKDQFKGFPTSINWKTVTNSMKPKNNLLDRKEASIRAYSEETRKRFLRSIHKSLIMGDNLTQAADRIEGEKTKYKPHGKGYEREPESFLDLEWALTSDWEDMIKREKGLKNFTNNFIDTERWRINRILRTEMHFAYNDSKLSGMETIRDKYNPKMKKSLYHPMDSRTGEDSKQLERKDPIIPMNKPFKFTYEYKRKDGTYKAYHRQFMYPPDRPNDRAILIPVWEE